VRLQGDDLARLVFGDAIIGRKAKDHTHVVMSAADSVELAESILKLRDELRRKSDVGG
jgi:hypothetical protein